MVGSPYDWGYTFKVIDGTPDGVTPDGIEWHEFVQTDPEYTEQYKKLMKAEGFDNLIPVDP